MRRVDEIIIKAMGKESGDEARRSRLNWLQLLDIEVGLLVYTLLKHFEGYVYDGFRDFLLRKMSVTSIESEVPLVVQLVH